MIRLWNHVHKRLLLVERKHQFLRQQRQQTVHKKRTAQYFMRIDKMVGYILADFRIARTDLEPLRTANYIVQYQRTA